MTKHDIITKIGQLETKHCDGCHALDGIGDNREIMDICLGQCKVGKQINRLGKRLDEAADKRAESKKIDQLNAIKRMSEQGCTIAEMCIELGVSKDVISRGRKKLGIARERKVV